MFIVAMMSVIGFSIFTTILAVNLSNRDNSIQMSPATRFIMFGILARCICQKRMSRVDAIKTGSSQWAVKVNLPMRHQVASDIGNPSGSNVVDAPMPSGSKANAGEDACQIDESTEARVNEWQEAADIIDHFSFCSVFIVLLIMILGTLGTVVIWKVYVLPKHETDVLKGDPCSRFYWQNM